MDICKDCGSEYDSTSVEIPLPLPDGICAVCGTELSAEKISEIVATIRPPQPIDEETAALLQRLNVERQNDD
jgi:hypothetical protein